MKSFFLTFTLLVGLGSVAQAQMKDYHAERPGSSSSAATAVRADELTRRLSRQLQLNEAQLVQLRKMANSKLARAEQIEWQYGADSGQRAAKLGELEAQYEAEYRRILTPSQLSLFPSELPRKMAPPSAAHEGGLG